MPKLISCGAQKIKITDKATIANERAVAPVVGVIIADEKRNSLRLRYNIYICLTCLVVQNAVLLW